MQQLRWCADDGATEPGRRTERTMLTAFERLVAFRYLRARRQEGFISVVAWFSLIGIMLGVATLIIVMSVMNGFRAELLGRILGLNGHVTVVSYERTMTDYQGVATQIRGLPGVESVTPLVEGQVMATANQTASGAVVRGLIATDFLARPMLRDSVRIGSLDGFDDGQGIVIGTRLANRLGLTVGAKVTLISPEGVRTAFGTVPRAKGYTVTGLFEVGMFEYDNSYIFMPLAEAQAYFRKPDAVTAIEVVIDDPDRAGQFAQDIRAQLPGTFRVADWQRVNTSFFNALQVERNVMFLILTLIILVAAFNIISSQIMLAKEKARGIAILRTMGAARSSILKIFFVTGSSVGIIGTALGAALGIAFAVNIESIRRAIEAISGTELFAAEIYFLSQLPAKIDTGEVVSVIVMALALSFLASIYPAWKAARTDPVEVLRYE